MLQHTTVHAFRRSTRREFVVFFALFFRLHSRKTNDLLAMHQTFEADVPVDLFDVERALQVS